MYQGSNSASSFCEISELLKNCVDRSAWESMALIIAPANSFNPGAVSNGQLYRGAKRWI